MNMRARIAVTNIGFVLLLVVGVAADAAELK